MFVNLFFLVKRRLDKEMRTRHLLPLRPVGCPLMVTRKSVFQNRPFLRNASLSIRNLFISLEKAGCFGNSFDTNEFPLTRLQ